jgi:hypothetical protein
MRQCFLEQGRDWARDWTGQPFLLLELILSSSFRESLSSAVSSMIVFIFGRCTVNLASKTRQLPAESRGAQESPTSILVDYY